MAPQDSPSPDHRNNEHSRQEAAGAPALRAAGGSCSLAAEDVGTPSEIDGAERPIWITGAGGFIGHNLMLAAGRYVPRWTILGLTHEQLDLTDALQVGHWFKHRPPAMVVHCAAQARAAACQANPQLARQINVEATARLADLAADIPFIFFSTDLVFDGLVGNYDEGAPVNPLTVYAETKAAAEQIVLANPKHTVIRTSLNGGTSPQGDRAFNEELRRAWQSGRETILFTDEFRSPIPVLITAQAVWELAALNRPGLYHLAGSERLSRYRIGQLVAGRWPTLHPRLVAGSLKDYRGPRRAPDTTLDCRKIQALLPFQLPGLTDWLSAHPHEVF